MRFLVLSLVAALLAGVAPATLQGAEYFTEDEIDLIRDAQELKQRVPVLFDLADRRLFYIGVKEKTEKQKEEARKLIEKRTKEAEKAARSGPRPTEPIDPEAYLGDFTRTELLRGYIQAIDEVMSNIDDYYERRFDVRDALESLEKYLSDTLPLLEKHQTKSPAEEAALLDARDKTQDSLKATREAMEVVPKTEKKAR